MRRRWIAGALAGAVLLGGGAWMLRPRPPERFPLAELVPADVRAYAGFPDYRTLEALPFPGREELARRLDPARPHLAGPVAFYLDRQGEWVGLARLTRASALFAGADVEDGAAVFAQSPEARERHRARRGRLSDVADFQALGARLYLALDDVRFLGRRDFSAAGFELASTNPVVLRGRALYRGETFRLYVERYLQAPRRPGPASGVAAAWTEPVVRLWDDVLAALDPVDREKTEREIRVLERDFLNGRSLRNFLDGLGSGWAVSLKPGPVLTLRLDVPDAGARATLEKMIHRATSDVAQFRRAKGDAVPYALKADGPLWRVLAPRTPELRLGPGFQPAFRFHGPHLWISSSAEALADPSLKAGGDPHHVRASIETAALIEVLRTLAPAAADLPLRAEAEKDAEILFLKAYGGNAREALRRQFPDASDLAGFLEGRRALLRAKVLEDLAKTPRGREERAKADARIEGLAKALSGFRAVTLSGDYTSDGLELELRLD